MIADGYPVIREGIEEGILERAREGKLRILQPRLLIHKFDEGKLIYRRTTRKAVAWHQDEATAETQPFHDPNNDTTHHGIPLTPGEVEEFTKRLLELFPKRAKKKRLNPHRTRTKKNSNRTSLR